MSRTIRIGSCEDAVAEIAALATRVIANGGHPGHDRESVGKIITSDAVLNVIRAGYRRRIAQGMSPKQACIAVGQNLVAHYCNSAGI